jgi:putative intracellular protease/amidase
MRFFQHVLSVREIERTGQFDARLERFDADVVPGGHGAAFHRLVLGPLVGTIVTRFHDAIPLLGHYMVPYREPVAVTLERAGASLLDSMLVFPRVHAAIDGHLATARGPWSDGPFVSAVLHLLASAPERAA